MEWHNNDCLRIYYHHLVYLIINSKNMLSLFNKKNNNVQKIVSSASKDCTNDPDCPMCHVSSDVVQQLKNEGKPKQKKDASASNKCCN